MNKPLQHTLLTQKHTSPHVHMPTTRSGTHSVHVPLQSHFCLLHYFHATQLSEKHAQWKGHTRTHWILRQPSLLRHMLGCFVEATLTACLTATSVCYEHGPVSPPPFLPLATSPLCFSLTLSLTSVLPPSLYSSLTGSAAPSIPHVELSTSSCTT